MTKHYPKGLDGRQRDKDGQARHKRRDTLIGFGRPLGPDLLMGIDPIRSLEPSSKRREFPRLISSSRKNSSRGPSHVYRRLVFSKLQVGMASRLGSSSTPKPAAQSV
jgi:hypothetical protein